MLEDQDGARWDRQLINEGQRLVEQSLASHRFGFYTIQAAISAVHADAATAAETDWNQIVSLYDVLLGIETSPVIELNRAVAIAMRDGSDAGLKIIDAILDRGELMSYPLARSARGELLRRIGDATNAIIATKKALSLTTQPAERKFLEQKLCLLNTAR